MHSDYQGYQFTNKISFVSNSQKKIESDVKRDRYIMLNRTVWRCDRVTNNTASINENNK